MPLTGQEADDPSVIREYKIIRLRDRDLGDHTLVVANSWGRFPQVWDVISRFDPDDVGMQSAHRYLVELKARQEELKDPL